MLPLCTKKRHKSTFNSSVTIYFFLFHFLLPSPFSKPCNEKSIKRRKVAISNSASKIRPHLYVEHGQQAVLNVYQILLICHDLCQVFVSLQQHYLSVHACVSLERRVTHSRCARSSDAEPQSAQCHT